MIGVASAKPTQYIEPIDESVYRLFDVKYSILENADGEIYKIFNSPFKSESIIFCSSCFSKLPCKHCAGIPKTLSSST